MTFNQTTVIEYKTNAGTVGMSTVTETGATDSSFDTVIAAGATDFHAAFNVDVSQVISFLMFSSAAVTIKTNNPTMPDQTFALSANQGFTWNTGQINSNPLTVDITDFYFTNAGATDATVNLRFLFI
jgi:hypothetical protein